MAETLPVLDNPSNAKTFNDYTNAGSNFLDLLLGKTKTTTSQTEIDPAAIQNMLQSMLETGAGGIQGLAGILGAQKGAGLYGSSTAGLLSGNLIAKILAEVAAKTAKITTNESSGKAQSDAAKKALTAGALGAAAKAAMGGGKGGKAPSKGAGPGGVPKMSQNAQDNQREKSVNEALDKMIEDNETQEERDNKSEENVSDSDKDYQGEEDPYMASDYDGSQDISLDAFNTAVDIGNLDGEDYGYDESDLTDLFKTEGEEDTSGDEEETADEILDDAFYGGDES